MNRFEKLCGLLAVLFAFAAVVLGLAVIVQGQGAPLKPTEEQNMRLQLKQKDAIIAYQQVQMVSAALDRAKEQHQAAFAALNAEADKVKAENKWDLGTIFNPDFNEKTPAFTAAPKPAEKPKPEKKP